METICTTVYQFDELSDSAKEKARDWWRRAESEDNSWSEVVIDDAKRIGALMGIEIDNIYWSGFSHQGQGACFTGYYSYERGAAKKVAQEVGDSPSCREVKRIARELQKVQRRNFYTLYAYIKHRGRGEHEYSTCIDVKEVYRDEDGEAIEDLLRDFMCWIYKSLESEYDYQNADEQVDEAIRINEYTFTEEGRRFG